MSKISAKLAALSAAVRSVFSEMHSIPTDKGDLYFEDELKVGSEVYSEAGGAAEDGDYVFDGMVYVIKGGVVEDIHDVPAEEVAEAEAEMSAEEEAKEAKEVPTESADEGDEEKEEPKDESKQEMYDEVRGMIDAIWQSIGEMNDKFAVLESRMADIEKAPEGVSPAEGFSSVHSMDEFGHGIEAIRAMRKYNKIK